MPAPAAVIPFPPTYRIGYSDGDQCGLVENADGLTLCFRQQWKAEQAVNLLRAQHPGLFFWVTWRPNS